MRQVEGMPMPSAGDAAAEGTSTDGESDTRVDEGAVCASASRWALRTPGLSCHPILDRRLALGVRIARHTCRWITGSLGITSRLVSLALSNMWYDAAACKLSLWAVRHSSKGL